MILNYERWQAFDLSLQVTKCTGIPRQMLYVKGSSEFVLKSYLKHRYWRSYFQAQIYK